MPESRGRGARVGASIAAAVLAVVAAAFTPAAIPLVVAIGVVVVSLVWWPTGRSRLTWAAAVPAVVSLAATGGHLAFGWPGLPPWGMVETVALCLLVGMIARWSSGRAAAVVAVAAGIAAATTLLRAVPATGSTELDGVQLLYAVAFWGLGPIASAAVGLHLRHQHERREREITGARREQRLDLAHDLHDYVAHDVSAMIAQAQAAQLVAGEGSRVVDALRSIEQSGLAAMASMDRTIGVLGETTSAVGPVTGAAPVRPTPGLGELRELVERFASSSRADDVRLDVDPAVEAGGRIPREVGGTVHRIVVEALTNVRRHAPGASSVEVRVRRVGSALEVSVVNGAGGPPADPGRRGGLGLPGLTERVVALSGTLRAGPHDEGWRVLASMPLTGGLGAGGS
ncbi:sensor histidine kinase [Occultella kanbiaonis]|uniref:sensor histidine kinase n=1 Tax=Occultella kanbiaonis TaxID=2675754 RepID=UPI0013D3F2B3|nr:histidine kinase [Occultella kanbiaonis]